MTNPTTPFSWQMPTASDLVTDLPADFETFGQAVATSMADLLGGTTGQILSKASNTDMDFTWVTNDVGDITAVTAGTGLSGGGTSGAVSLAIDSTVATLTGTQTLTNKTLTSPALTTPTISTLTTNGDLLYGTGSGALQRRAIGTTGQVLTVTGGLPTWETPAAGGGGKVLQVVSTTYSTATTVASTTLTDTGLSLSITPTLSTSKILVIVSQACYCERDTNAAYLGIKLLRGATSIYDLSGTNAKGFGLIVVGATLSALSGNLTFSYLDSPATTSATTYKLQGNIGYTVSGSSIWQHSSTLSTITLLEIGA